MVDASPFSWFTALSPVLNVYCEPPQYLPEETRRLFEPIAFFGSLSPDDLHPESRPREPPGSSGRRTAVYVSLGTNVWGPRSRPVTLRALAVIAGALGRRTDLDAIVSLGGVDVSEEEVAPLRRANVTVEPRVDQLAVLAGSDLFFTQNGLNSTHEAVYHRVPMIPIRTSSTSPRSRRPANDWASPFLLPPLRAARSRARTSIVRSSDTRRRARRCSPRSRSRVGGSST